MLINLLSKLILWLKKIFFIHKKSTEKKDIPPQLTELKKTDVLPQKIKEIHTSDEEKLKEVTNIPTIEVQNKVEPLEEKQFEVHLEPEGQKSELKGGKKPYKKKLPTKEEKHGKPLKDKEKKSDIPPKKEEKDLGSAHGKKARLTKNLQHSAEVSIEENETESERRETPSRTESPFIEIDLDEAKVFLILPEQQFNSNADNFSQTLTYNLELNDEKQKISVRVSKDRQSITKAEEKKIEIKNPLNHFKIVFPDELQGRAYNYEHSNRILYAFIAIGNNRGKMHYLYDKNGNLNNIPQRVVWILLHEDYVLGDEQDVISEEERWVWENYRPFFINLESTNELIVRNRQNSKEEKIPCKATFSIEGEDLVEDDFKDQSPLFSGKTVKIKAPMENQSRWTVWIQNKQAGYRILAENWTGAELLKLECPDDLPCECGEFQVDVCEQGERVPVSTLFFRYIPALKLDYKKSLVIPGSNQGHKPEIISVFLQGGTSEWELIPNANEETAWVGDYCNIKLPPEKDILRLSTSKRGKPETEVNIRITIPRLRWRTSEQATWNDKVLQIKRDELILGEDHDLIICTNDFDTRYDLLAILDSNSQRLQSEKLIRKGVIYTYYLLLNRFYDTVMENKDELSLRLEIRKAETEELLGQVDVIRFPEIIKVKPIDKPSKQPVLSKFFGKEKRCKNKRPLVKGGTGKMRKGRGFSRQEVIGTDISMNAILSMGIPFDKRRKSVYQQNIEILKSLTGANK